MSVSHRPLPPQGPGPVSLCIPWGDGFRLRCKMGRGRSKSAPPLIFPPTTSALRFLFKWNRKRSRGGVSLVSRSLGLSPGEQEDFLKAYRSLPFFPVLSQTKQTKPNLRKPGPASPVQPLLCVPTSCFRPGFHVISPESSSLLLMHYPPLSPFSKRIPGQSP